MSKLLQSGEIVRKSLKAGIKKLARAVGVTLGPKGGNVIIEQAGFPLLTKDGGSIAKAFVMKDKFENLAAQLVREVASQTADTSGDGTTTAIVLTEAIFSEGLKRVAAGVNPMLLKQGIDVAIQVVIKELESQSVPVESFEKIKQVGAISSNNDAKIGEMIAQAMEKVGKDGIITVDEAKGVETTLEIVEGMQFDRGYLSPYFVTHSESMTAEFENVSTLLVEGKLSLAKQLIPFLEHYSKESRQTPLLIIGEEIEGEALATLVVNKIKGGLSLCAIKSSGFGEQQKTFLQDLAALTGSTVVSQELGMDLEEVRLEVLGVASKVRVGKNKTTIMGCVENGPLIQEQVLQIRSEIENARSEYEKERLETRLAKLAGGLAIIRVGAETEMKEKKGRVEDALHATQAAVSEGILPGGGVALLRAEKVLATLTLSGEAQYGIDIVKKALSAPLKTIVRNCGEEVEVIAERVRQQDGTFGYNALTGSFEDLFSAGIIDPVRVTRTALKNAASIAGVTLTASFMIVDKPVSKDPTSPS